MSWNPKYSPYFYKIKCPKTVGCDWNMCDPSDGHCWFDPLNVCLHFFSHDSFLLYVFFSKSGFGERREPSLINSDVIK